MSTFRIAIVGRPNVGKSTLFNRLAGRRLALVDPTPGLTRDRRETEIEVFERKAVLIDTAGLEEAGADTIAARMRDQSMKAVAECDLVLFVIDARAGVTAGDEVFAALVRETGRPVMLVANKCEGRAGTDGFYDAYALGFGEPVAISAEHGEGISDLLAEMFAAMGGDIEAEEDGEAGEDAPEESEAERLARPLRIAVVGRPNAGKSTLVNTILGEERMITGPEAGITRDSIAVETERQGRRLRIFDTAGLRRKARIEERAEELAASDAIRAIKFAEVVVLLVDVDRALEKQDLAIADLVLSEGRALVVGLNKWDVVEEKQKRLKEIHEEAERVLPDARGLAIVPVSARSGQGVEKLVGAVLDAEETWNRRVSTAELNRWLAVATERHAPPAVAGKRIRLRYMTQPSTRPPTFVAFCQRAEKVPKSYVRYLVNSLRDSFDIPGVPIRFNLRKGANPYAK
ncbi:MAG: ribosome biogenesis GTPase Der [Hyphomicrobiaceae bacterium]